jgi:type VI secretion system protein ImpL
MTNRYLAVGVSFVALLVLAWATAGPLLGLQGRQFWILYSGVAALGAIGACIYLWIRNLPQRSDAPAVSNTGRAGDDEDASLLIKAAELALSRSGKAPEGLGNLPLFFVLGEQESAKTSNIVNSGLDPELLAGQVFEDRDIVATQPANIWFSRGIIFAEAGGALLSNPDQWKTLIRRLRPSRVRSVFGRKANAPRAALVCVDGETFLRTGAHNSLDLLVRKLRDRLCEISSILGISFPVYVLFTRMDRFPFFAEFVRNFSSEEAAQPMGAVLPAGPISGTYAEEQTRRIQTGFDDLFYYLAGSRPEQLIREHDFDRLPCIYEFPREFRKVRSMLTRFLVELCKPRELHDSPFLRGFYFSGIREIVETDLAPAAPVQSRQAERYANVASGATGAFAAADFDQPGAALPSKGSIPVSGRRIPQWVFLKTLFAEIFPQDRAAMKASVASSKTALAQRALLVAAGLLCFFWLTAMIVSFMGNKSIERRIETASKNYRNEPATGATLPLDQLKQMDTLRSVLEDLRGYADSNSPLRLHWGLYTAERLYPPARRLYFQRLFGPPLFYPTQTALLNRLRQLPASPGPDDQFSPGYETLKAYLITTSHHDKSTHEWLSPVLLRTWSQGRDGSERSQLAGRQFDFYSDELRLENPYTPAEETGTVKHARDYLNGFNQLDRVYRLKLDQAAAGHASINFNALFPQNAIGDKHVVKAEYTKAGWTAMQDAIRKGGITGEDWVLWDNFSGGKNEDKLANQAQLQQQLRERYQTDYIREWYNFVQDAYVAGYSNLSDAAQKLSKTAAGNQSPLLELLTLVSDNTAVNPEIAKRFAPASIAVQGNKPYMDALVALQLAIENVAGNPDPANPALAQSQTSATSAKALALQLGGTFPDDREGGVNQYVRNLLLDPITHAEKLLKGAGAAQLNEAGRSLCKEASFIHSFPFNPQAKNSANMDDVNQFFQPGTGKLWQFYNERLKTLLVPSGTGYTTQASGGVNLTPTFVRFFNNAAEFSKSAYENGSPQPKVEFVLTSRGLQGANEITITIGGRSLTITPTSRSTMSVIWPAQQLSIRVDDKPYSSVDGPWSLFTFFAGAQKWEKAATGSTYDVEWALSFNTQLGRIPINRTEGQGLLRLGGVPRMFQKNYFSGMTCPSVIAQ